MAVPLRTRREKAHYGDKVMIGETPAVKIKAGKKNDYMTATEVVEDLYGMPIQYIMFKKMGGHRMRTKKNNEIRTAKEDIMVGTKIKDHETGAPVALIKGKGDKYDTFSVQEFAEALYGKGIKVTIHTA